MTVFLCKLTIGSGGILGLSTRQFHACPFKIEGNAELAWGAATETRHELFI